MSGISPEWSAVPQAPPTSPPAYHIQRKSVASGPTQVYEMSTPPEKPQALPLPSKEAYDNVDIRTYSQEPINLQPWNPAWNPSIPVSRDGSYAQTSGFKRPPHTWWWWWPELLGCFVALICLVAQGVVLVIFDGRPQSAWTNERLTLNGLIAILATVCRSTLMVAVTSAMSQAKWNRLAAPERHFGGPHRLDDFALLDRASRGLRGSAQVLVRFRLVHMSCIGAILTMATLAFAFFAQQLITVQVVPIDIDDLGLAGNVSRAVIANSVLSLRVDDENSQLDYELDPLTKLAWHAGFVGEGLSQPEVECPTGNCTWPVVPTIGVCGTCVDMSDQVVIRRNDSDSDSCIVSVPDGPTFEASCEISDEWTTMWTIGKGMGKVLPESSDDHRWPSRDAPNVIAEFSALGISLEVLLHLMDEEDVLSLEWAGSVDCALWYCLQARSISVVNGVLNDTIKDVWNQVEEHSQQISENATDLERQMQHLADYFTFTEYPDSFNVQESDEFVVYPGVMPAMQHFVNSTITGNLEWALLEGKFGLPATSNEYAEAFWHNFYWAEDWIHVVAEALTTGVRRNRDSPEFYPGTVHGSEVIVVVRWEWFAYPAAIILVTILYLVAEIVRTRMIDNVLPWKDDALLPLCMDLDPGLRDQALDGVNESNGIHTRIGWNHVQLRMDPGTCGRVARE